MPFVTSRIRISKRILYVVNRLPPRNVVASIALLVGSVALINPSVASAAALLSPQWSLSNSVTGVTSTSTYTLTTNTASNLSSFTMTLPVGTTGTPILGNVVLYVPTNAVAAPSGEQVSLSGNVLTYSFTPTWINANTTFIIPVTRLTNTTTVGSYASQFTTYNGTAVVDSGTAAAVSITSTSLVNSLWNVTNSALNTASVTYSYSFTTATTSNLSSVTMVVPPGTGGTPALGTVSGLPNGTLSSITGNTLTYSFTSTPINSSTPVSIGVTGLTNTATFGTYQAQITTFNGSTPVDSGLPAPLSMSSGTLTNASWALSNSSAGATSVNYTYNFTTATNATYYSITLTLPPGTSGTPTLGTVTGLPANGTLSSITSSTITYTFASTWISSGTALSIEVTGLTNTSASGNYTSQITTMGSNSAPMSVPQDTAITPTESISGGALRNTLWSTSVVGSGATNVTYSFNFTTASSSHLSSITMTVPLGTNGTPTLGTVSGLPAGSVSSISTSTITYSFGSTLIAASTVISIQITGLTNTTTTESYTSQIVTHNGTSLVDSGQTGAVSIAAVTIATLSWNLSNAQAAATGVTYTYGFTTASSSSLSSVTMTVPPGTNGTPTLGTVTLSNGGNTVTPPSSPILSSISSDTLTYSFTSTYFNALTVWTIPISGLTNTSTAVTYTCQITTVNTTAIVDSGLTAPESISAGTLVTPSWTTSAVGSGATNVTYTYNFTTASSSSLSSVTMTLPSGTNGTPTLGTVSGLPAGSVSSISANTITYSFTPKSITASTVISIQITGLTNTTTTGTYTSQIVTHNGTTPVDTGQSTSVSIAGGTITTLSWSVSNAVAAATGVTYSYTFTTVSSSLVSSVSVTVPPGTSGTPGVGAGSPLPAGSVSSISANTITYSFTSTWINAGSPESLAVTGLTNTTVATSYTSQITTSSGSNAVDSGITATATITFGPASASASTLSASPTSVTADGTSTSTLTVTLRDANGNPIAGKVIKLAAGTGSSTISPASGSSNSSGVVTFTVSNTVAQSVTYTATDTTPSLTLSATASVNFTSNLGGISVGGGALQGAVTFTSRPPSLGSVGDVYTVTATTPGPGAITFSVNSSSSICSLSGYNTVILNGPGTCVVVASVGANNLYDAASASQTFNVAPVNLAAPSNITVIPGVGQVMVSWTLPSNASNFIGVVAKVTATPGGASCSSSATWCLVTGLTNGTTYVFSVTAFAAGPVPTSSPANSSPPVAPSTADSPTASPDGLTELNPGDGQVTTSDGATSTPTILTSGNRVVMTSGPVSITVIANATTGSGLSSTLVITSGSRTNFAGSGFVPGTTIGIYMFSRGTLLGTALVQTNGSFAVNLSVPTTLNAGSHTVVVQGFATTGKKLRMAIGLLVKRPILVRVTIANFVRGTWWLNPAMKYQIAKLAKQIRHAGTLVVQITGFSDIWGGHATDLLMSRQRALVVEAFLRSRLRLEGVRQNIPLRVIAMGDRSPVASNNTAAGQAANRRVVLQVALGTGPINA